MLSAPVMSSQNCHDVRTKLEKFLNLPLDVAAKIPVGQ